MHALASGVHGEDAAYDRGLGLADQVDSFLFIGAVAVEGPAVEDGAALREMVVATPDHALRHLAALGLGGESFARQLLRVGDEYEFAARCLALCREDSQMGLAAGEAVNGVGDERSEFTSPNVFAVAGEFGALEQFGTGVNLLRDARDRVAEPLGVGDAVRPLRLKRSPSASAFVDTRQ